MLECSRDYNLWLPLSSSKNAIVIEHVFTDVAVVFPKLSNCSGDVGDNGLGAVYLRWNLSDLHSGVKITTSYTIIQEWPQRNTVHFSVLNKQKLSNTSISKLAAVAKNVVQSEKRFLKTTPSTSPS